MNHLENKWVKFSLVILILFLGSASSLFFNVFYNRANESYYSFINNSNLALNNEDYLNNNQYFNDFIFNITLNDFFVSTSTLIFLKQEFEQNYSISTCFLENENLSLNFTLIDFSDILLLYITNSFKINDSWNLTISFPDYFSAILINEPSLLRPINIYPTFYQIEDSINYSFNIDRLIHNFNFESTLNTQFLTSFFVFPRNKETSDLLIENSNLLEGYEFPYGGSFQTDLNKEGELILDINIFDLSVYATKTTEIYLKNNNTIFYSIAKSYVFLYWNLQRTFFDTFKGAVPDFRYFQRISGEFYNPLESIHIRNIGDITRHFLAIRRFFNQQDLFFINQSINWSLNYLQNEDVFQNYRNDENWWVHDIDNGIKNHDWILNSHTGTILTLLLARNEGFEINNELLTNGLKLLLKSFWDFEMGENRIAYALTYFGNQYSFTEKSDNYELLVALDFLMMKDLLEDKEKTEVIKNLSFIYKRYLPLETDYIDKLLNKGVLFELSLFFNDTQFLQYQEFANWFEHYLFFEFVFINNATKFPVFGSENYVFDIQEDINFDDLNISSKPWELLILYNKETTLLTTYNRTSFVVLKGQTIIKESILIVYRNSEIKEIKSSNNIIHLLFIFSQIIILIIISMMIFLKIKKPEFYEKINIINTYNEKIIEKNRIISILNLVLFIALGGIPVLINFENYSYALTNGLSLLIRRVVNYSIISQILLITSLAFVFLYLLSKMLYIFIKKENPSDSENSIIKKINLLGKIFSLLFNLILVCVFWSLIFNICTSHMNLASLILYSAQLISISLVMKYSDILPKENSKLTINLSLVHTIVLLFVGYLMNFIDIFSIFEITNRNYNSALNIPWKLFFVLSVVILSLNFSKIFEAHNFKRKNVLLNFLFSIQFLFLLIISLFLLIYPYYYNSLNYLKIIMYFITLSIVILLFKKNLIINRQGLIIDDNDRRFRDFYTRRFSWNKIAHISAFILLFILNICLLIFTKATDYHNFETLDIFKGILFLIWILYGTFLLEQYKILSFSKTIGLFTFNIIITSTIYIFTLSRILFLPILLFIYFTVSIILLQPNSERREWSFYRSKFLDNRYVLALSLFFIFFTIISQIIWSFKSPDSLGYFLTARNLVENNILEITDPLLSISPGFVRKLFYQVSETSMKIQYPIGSIYLLAIFIQFASYWRIMFIIYSIVFSIQILNLYRNFIQKEPKPLIILLILFNSQLLIQITTGFGIDFIATTISLLAINSLIKYIRRRRKIEIINLVMFTLIIPLLKTSVFIFYIFLVFVLIIYFYFIDQNLKNKVNTLIGKYKILIIFGGIILITSGILVLAFSLSGYLNQFSIFEKLLKPYILLDLTLYNLSINFIQILIVYLPILIEFVIPQNWRFGDDKNTVEKDVKKIIILPLLLFAFIFIFFWNSSNLYPFDIGSRYFLLFSLIFAVFSNIHKYKKALKYFLISYILLSNGLVIFHAASLDYSNQKFSKSVTDNIQENAIIVTNYYSKLFPDNSVYTTGVEYAGEDFEIINDISWLLEQNYTLYFIPEGITSYDRAITENFHLDLILEYDSGWVSKLFPKIFGQDLFNPAPRKLFLISN